MSILVGLKTVNKKLKLFIFFMGFNLGFGFGSSVICPVIPIEKNPETYYEHPNKNFAEKTNFEIFGFGG